MMNPNITPIVFANASFTLNARYGIKYCIPSANIAIKMPNNSHIHIFFDNDLLKIAHGRNINT